MSLPTFSIKKPITMLVIYSILIFSGLASLTQLPVELYPNISFGEISIIIEVRGGIPPTEVESLVSKPVEEAVGSVSHLAEMMSPKKGTFWMLLVSVSLISPPITIVCPSLTRTVVWALRVWMVGPIEVRPGTGKLATGFIFIMT